MALILNPQDFSKPFYMETNASDFALKAVLLQKRDDKNFIQKKFNHKNQL